MRRLAEHFAEAADEVRLRHVGDRRHRSHVERLGVVPIHPVAGAQQASVAILDLPAHAGNATASTASARRIAGGVTMDSPPPTPQDEETPDP